MRSIFKYAIPGVFCCLFLLHGAVSAQDNGKPSSDDKTKKTEKSEKNEKPVKPSDGLAPVTLKDLAVDFPEVEG
ncbi:MAG: hypothetical protein M3384_15695, partial [Acidobacteriota bacterium]|nr:hypothetical protein [Acidobacteriota bacterium]